MNVVRQDNQELIREQAAIERKQREEDDRNKYLTWLKGSRKFQKYIVKEIFEKELNETFTLDNLPVSDEMEKLGAVSLQYVLARKAVKKIIDKLR